MTTSRTGLRLCALIAVMLAGTAAGGRADVRLDHDGILVEYSIPGELVKIELLRYGIPAAALSGWMENTGVYRHDEAIPPETGSGPGFTVRITSDLGAEVWSAEFEMRFINVVEPSGGETLTLGTAADLEVIWEAWPEAISIHLYRGDVHLERIAEGVPAGSWSMRWTDTVPAGWQPGDDYRIRLSDGRGSRGWSGAFSVAADWNTLKDNLPALEPGGTASLEFPPGTDTHLFLLHALPLRAYSFDTDRPDLLLLEILDADGNPVVSSDRTSEDRGSSSAALYWDCLEGGEYFLRVSRREGATSGLTLTVNASPGWDAAFTLADGTVHTSSIDYPGDVDYFYLRLKGNIVRKDRCEVIAAGPDGIVLALVDPDEFEFERSAAGGNEVSLERSLKLFSGSRDLYFAVTAPEGSYTVRSTIGQNAVCAVGTILIPTVILMTVSSLLIPPGPD